VEEAIAKAGALIEAMEYIRSFRGRVVVVKLGGSVLDDAVVTVARIELLATLGGAMASLLLNLLFIQIYF